MTSEVLIGIAGMVLSLLFSYIPGLRAWYAGLAGEVKQIIMLGLLIAVTASVYGLGCAGVIDSGVVCGKEGIIALVKLLILGLVANQSTYLISPQTGDARAAKDARNAAG